jgi:hypothetical protein
MSSRDEGGWVFIGEKKLRVPPTILESRIHSVLFERTSDTILLDGPKDASYV